VDLCLVNPLLISCEHDVLCFLLFFCLNHIWTS